MKSCPTCNRTFEDTFTFCLIDGSVLSAPFDPASTKERSPSRDSVAPPTEVISATPEPLPPTRAATPGDLPPTIAAPFVQQPMRQAAQPFVSAEVTQAGPVPDVVRWMFILRGVITILLGFLLLLWGPQ
ncbi:MAG TPA: hypothetical protein VIF81_11790 [Pyrinomonadaceae bacterium]